MWAAVRRWRWASADTLTLTYAATACCTRLIIIISNINILTSSIVPTSTYSSSFTIMIIESSTSRKVPVVSIAFASVELVKPSTLAVAPLTVSFCEMKWLTLIRSISTFSTSSASVIMISISRRRTITDMLPPTPTPIIFTFIVVPSQVEHAEPSTLTFATSCRARLILIIYFPRRGWLTLIASISTSCSSSVIITTGYSISRRLTLTTNTTTSRPCNYIRPTIITITIRISSSLNIPISMINNGICCAHRLDMHFPEVFSSSYSAAIILDLGSSLINMTMLFDDPTSSEFSSVFIATMLSLFLLLIILSFWWRNWSWSWSFWGWLG